jgi:MFS family permease
MILFGLIDFVDSAYAYVVLSFICRFIEGFGNCCLNSSASAIISSVFEDNMSTMMSLQQAFTGLGMLAGPILGSLLYQLGGF